MGDSERDDILVIDDDPGITTLLVSLLRDEEGYTVRAAHSVRQALSCPNPAPTLIFLDLSLHGEDVRALVSELRALPGWETSHIVLCSGQEGLDAACRQLGAVEYLHKPFDLDTVVELAARLARPRMV